MIAEWCSTCGGETLLPFMADKNILKNWKCEYCGEKLRPCAQFDCASGDCCQEGKTCATEE